MSLTFDLLLSHLLLVPQGDQEVKGAEPAQVEGGAEVEPDKFELPPDSDEEYMVVEEADASAAGRAKRSGLSRIESFKATFSRENMSKTRENLGTKVNQLGERIVPTERRQRIRQSGERLKETIAKGVHLKKERTVAEGQEGAGEGGGGAGADPGPVPPPKGRKGSLHAAQAGEGKAGESEVQMYDMKQLS